MTHDVTLTSTLGVAIQIRNRMFREAIAAQLDGEPDLRVVGTTAFGAELFRLCELRNPEIVLFEVDPGREEQLNMLAELRMTHRQLRLVGIYDHPEPDPEIAERLQMAGVNRFVTYSGGVARLLAAVRPPIGGTVLRNGKVQRPSGALMTDREVRILHLISSGYTLEQVAEALNITPRTVENYKRRIFAKLDTHSQAHAAAYAVRLGLLPAPPERGARIASEPTEHGVVALLCGRPGALADQIAKLLIGEGIPLIVDRSGLQPIVDHPARHTRGSLVVVLVDPEPVDWSVPLDLPSRILLVLSTDPGQAVMVEAVLRGADALISAAHLDETLVSAFRLVEAGYMLVNAEQARKFIGAGYARMARMSPYVPLELTPREQQILCSIDHGHSVKQTARTLGISVKTVESLQSRLFRKLGIRNRAEALVVAYGLGLIPHTEQELG